MTIAGHHTVAELREWLEHIDYEVAQVEASFASIHASWAAQDPTAAKEWASEWDTLRGRYRTVRLRAEIAIARAKVAIGVSDSVIPAEDEWQAVLHALSVTPGTVSRGDLQDLYNRLSAVSAKPVIDASKAPKPHAADADLSVLQAANATIRAGEKAAAALVDAAEKTKMSPGTKVIVLGGVVLGLFLAAKSVLR